MCILNDDCAVVKNGQLKLWKVVRKDNVVGLWRETYNRCNQIVFTVGVNTARNYGITAGRYHCFFTRNAAQSSFNIHILKFPYNLIIHPRLIR